MKTTAQMCSEPATRAALHDVYFGAGALVGAAVGWAMGGEAILIAAGILVYFWWRAGRLSG